MFPLDRSIGLEREPDTLATGYVGWTDADGSPVVIEIRYGGPQGGQTIPWSATIRRSWAVAEDFGTDPGVITASLLRRIPFGRVLEASARSVLDQAEIDARVRDSIAHHPSQPPDHPSHPTDLLTFVSRQADRTAAAAAAIEEGPAGRGRPPVYDAGHWSLVATTYLDALGSGAPTATVAERFSVSRSTAAKWVARCRDHGLLPPTTRGVAGGIARVHPPLEAQ